MRQDRAREAWAVLGQAEPSTPAQREECDLLNGEASFRLGNYPAAESSFTSLLGSNSGSPFAPQAELGLAWSYIRQGEYARAREHLDSLSNRDDSIGIAALYQGAVLAMLAGDEFTALSKFDTLTVRSPYDRFAEWSYVQMGLMHYRTRRYRDAKKYFSYALSLFPGSERSCVPAWEGNWTSDCFLAFAWHGPGGDRLLVAVNYAPNQSQCYVRLPFTDLGGGHWRLQDLLADTRYDRDGNDLQSRGLYLDVPPRQYHAFNMTR